MNLSSQISKITLEGREFLVKRDDLFDPYLSGNKYRKLHTFLNLSNSAYTKVISYGGTQSNAMLAIAAMAKRKAWDFTYYSKPIAQTMKESKLGNYFEALNLGMKHIEIETKLYKNFIASLSLNNENSTLLIHQGGADRVAKEGLESLALEIQKEFAHDETLNAVCTPSGTGTTALFLALALPTFRVYTVPCVGDSEYLREQMRALCEIPPNLTILQPKKKYHFAKPYREFYGIYKDLKERGIEFDLLYAPSMWMSILEQTQEKILYIHSGGVSGNESMLQRYKKKQIF